MDLRTYLITNRYTVQAFADLLGYSRIHISTVVNGRQNCGKALAKMIEKETKGKVPASSWKQVKAVASRKKKEKQLEEDYNIFL